MARIAARAYDDAVMQGAYNAILPSEFKSTSDKTRKTVSDRMVSRFLYGIFEKDFDPVSVMELIKSAYDKDVNGYSEYFSFGNAQKWVNMTIKYILIVNKLLSSVDDRHEFCKVGKEFEKNKTRFDLPVDSYILEKLWDMKEICIPIRAEERKGSILPTRSSRGAAGAEKTICVSARICIKRSSILSTGKAPHGSRLPKSVPKIKAPPLSFRERRFF